MLALPLRLSLRLREFLAPSMPESVRLRLRPRWTGETDLRLRRVLRSTSMSELRDSAEEDLRRRFPLGLWDECLLCTC